jgi:hypothetical protein
VCFRAIHCNFNCPCHRRQQDPDIHSFELGALLLSFLDHIRSFTSSAGRFERQCDITVGLFVGNTDSEFPPLFVPVVAPGSAAV